MYLFMNMLFQKMIEKTPKDPTPTQGDFKPREEPPHDHDHHHETLAHVHGD
jgi:hypothetical protein